VAVNHGFQAKGAREVPQIQQTSGNPASEIPHVPEKSRGLRVLIVDDEPLIRWSLAETLSESGHRVTEASDGASALRSLHAGESPDVIVLDYRLPDSSDLSLLMSIRQHVPGAAVIMMTAFGAPEMTCQALSLGVWRIVPKPFEVHEMADLVNQAGGLPPTD
jgi:two-component system, NtrC family, response regulator AtoC